MTIIYSLIYDIFKDTYDYAIERFWDGAPNEQTRLANVLLLIAAIGSTFIFVLNIYNMFYQQLNQIYVWTFAIFTVLIWTITLRENWPAIIRIGLILVGGYALVAQDQWVMGHLAESRLLLVVLPLLVYILLGEKWGRVTAVFSAVLLLAFTYWQMTDQLPLDQRSLNITIAGHTWVTMMVIYGFSLGLVLLPFGLVLQSTEQRFEQARRLEQQLAAEAEKLEQRVVSRSRALTTSLELSNYIAEISSMEAVMSAAVRLLHASYDYYQVQIYLLDSSKQYVNFFVGVGEPAEQMKKRGYRLPVWQGITGQVAGRNEPILATDIQQAKDFQPNPFLPDARSEVTVPIRFAGELLGVLDVQHTAVDGLSTDDLYLLQTISEQISIALENARVYAQAQAYAQQQQDLKEILETIRQCKTPEETLQIASQELAHLLKANRVHIGLG